MFNNLNHEILRYTLCCPWFAILCSGENGRNSGKREDED